MPQITDEELNQINDLRSKLSTVVSETGQLTLQASLLETDLLELNARISEQTKAFKGLIEEEQNLVNRLSEKYGTGSINFETGEFTSDR